MDDIKLVRFVADDDQCKTLRVGVWHDQHQNTWHARVLYDEPKRVRAELEPGEATEEAAEARARGCLEQLRSQGWKGQLSAEEQARVDDKRAKQRAARDAAEQAAEQAYQARLAVFPKTEVDRKLAAAMDQPAEVVSLDLRGSAENRLTLIPRTIEKLKKLQVLYLEDNELTEIPWEFESLRLRELYLGGNALTDLGRIGAISQLRVLDLRDNRIAEMHEHFGFIMPKGLQLDLGGNPLRPAAPLGTVKKLGVLGIDTAALFPLGERFDAKRLPLSVLRLYGRAPTDGERQELAKRFPKATIEHHPGPAGHERRSADPAPTRAKPQPPRKRRHREQVADEKALIALAKDRGVAVKTIKTLGRPCVQLVSRPANKVDMRRGWTRLGGAPDLPKAAPWPEGEAGPMLFVAQIDLAKTAPYDALGRLPAAGHLWFFASDHHEGAVLYAAPDVTLERREPPTAAQFGGMPESLPATGVTLRGAIDLPCDRADHDDDYYDDEPWRDLLESNEERRGEEPAHRLLGYAFGDTEIIDWDEEVLLVLDSDDRAGMLWGDCGRLYFVLHPAALAAGEWGEVRVGSTD